MKFSQMSYNPVSKIKLDLIFFYMIPYYLYKIY